MFNNLLWPIILQLLGVVVIIAEMILPSAGLLTVAALGLFGYSLFLIFTTVSVSVGFIFLVIDIITIPILTLIGIKILAASPATLKTTLGSGDGSSGQESELKGIEGITTTDLHPAGTAILNGKRYDVISSGEYINKGTQVVVSAVNGNRIVVKSK